MDVVNLIFDNYWDSTAVASVFFMTVFILVMKLSDKGEYGFGIVILATAVCSLLWPITVSYFLINWIVDLTLRVAKK